MQNMLTYANIDNKINKTTLSKQMLIYAELCKNQLIMANLC